MAKMSPMGIKAYATYEKKEPAGIKKKELTKPEGKKEKKREMQAGMKMVKKAAPMKKMGKKK